jgi:hypothetical protein
MQPPLLHLGGKMGTPEFQVNESGRVRARVRLGASKIHGPNSPEVLTGQVSLGHRENVEFDGESAEQIVELDYESFASLVGREKADEVFRGVENVGS